MKANSSDVDFNGASTTPFSRSIFISVVFSCKPMTDSLLLSTKPGFTKHHCCALGKQAVNIKDNTWDFLIIVQRSMTGYCHYPFSSTPHGGFQGKGGSK